ncbi:MAG: hypothetical protein ACUVTO_01530 [Candidatus Caldatribacteriaceae bacterium]
MRRDVLILPLQEEELLVACDVLGGIGPKAYDVLPAPLEIAAQFTTRVALAEILALGGEPLALSLTLSIEPYPFLEEAKKGIMEELRSIGLEELPIIVSTEKNMKTLATGLGVTVVGKRLKPKREEAQEGTLYALGAPAVGEEVLRNIERVADLRDIALLRRAFPNVPIVPVGSQGILHEALLFLVGSGLHLCLRPPFPYSLYQSCGPATVILFVSQEKEEVLKTLVRKPLWVVGELRA